IFKSFRDLRREFSGRRDENADDDFEGCPSEHRLQGRSGRGDIVCARTARFKSLRRHKR
ncbi:unnamed protein product, partial [Phaeothamnion confervicola]